MKKIFVPFNETAKVVLRSMRNANFSPSKVNEMKEKIRVNGGKVVSAEIDPDSAKVKFDNGVRFELLNY